MAEKRMIHRRITESDKLLALANQGRTRACMIYAYHLPYLDKSGRMKANPHGLKGTIWEAWPYTAADIASDLDAMASVGLIRLYKTGRGELVLEYAKFDEHHGGFNKPHNNEPESALPGSEDEESAPHTALLLVGNVRDNVPDNVVHNVPDNNASEYEYELEIEKEKEKDFAASSEARHAEYLATGKAESQTATPARAFFRRLIGSQNANHPQARDELTRWYTDHGETTIRDLWAKAKDNPENKPRFFWFIDALNGLKGTATIKPGATALTPEEERAFWGTN